MTFGLTLNYNPSMSELLTEIHRALGLTQAHFDSNLLALHEQPALADLQVVEIDFEGRPFILVSSAAEAWVKMKESARRDEIVLMPFSGFRSYLHQKSLIDLHLKNGRKIEDILTHIAIPGFSEHHSGRAIDIHAKGHPVLEEAFERTEQFAWLLENSNRFGFRLSYPKGNSTGIIYEPWHWFFAGT